MAPPAKRVNATTYQLDSPESTWGSQIVATVSVYAADARSVTVCDSWSLPYYVDVGQSAFDIADYKLVIE